MQGCSNFAGTNSMIMEVSYSKTEKSKGFRLHKTQQDKNQIVIKPLDNSRKGWERAFKKIAANEEDRLLFDDVFEDENLEEWK